MLFETQNLDINTGNNQIGLKRNLPLSKPILKNVIKFIRLAMFSRIGEDVILYFGQNGDHIWCLNRNLF